MPLGDETITHDADRHERRTRVGAIALCPGCGEMSPLAITEQLIAFMRRKEEEERNKTNGN